MANLFNASRFLEGIKDHGLKATMAGFMVDSDILKFDDVQWLIYNTCDVGRISNQEVHDINYIVRHFPLVESDRARILRLVRRFTANREGYLKFSHFESSELEVISKDFIAAHHRVSQASLLFLAIASGGGFINPLHGKLLKATFDIEWNAPGTQVIRRRLSLVSQYISRASFIYRSHQIENRLAFAQRHDEGRYTIYVMPRYFDIEDAAYRESILIHEMIHCLLHHQKDDSVDGHPGGLKTNRHLPLGVRFSQASGNPYCYQWFAYWFDHLQLANQFPPEPRNSSGRRNTGPRSPRNGTSTGARSRHR